MRTGGPWQCQVPGHSSQGRCRSAGQAAADSLGLAQGRRQGTADPGPGSSDANAMGSNAAHPPFVTRAGINRMFKSHDVIAINQGPAGPRSSAAY